MATRNRKTRLAALEKTHPPPATLPDLQARGQISRSKIGAIFTLLCDGIPVMLTYSRQPKSRALIPSSGIEVCRVRDTEKTAGADGFLTNGGNACHLTAAA